MSSTGQATSSTSGLDTGKGIRRRVAGDGGACLVDEGEGDTLKGPTGRGDEFTSHTLRKATVDASFFAIFTSRLD